jgi:hypothetical protein
MSPASEPRAKQGSSFVPRKVFIGFIIRKCHETILSPTRTTGERERSVAVMTKLDTQALAILGDILALGERVFVTRRNLSPSISVVDSGLHAEWVTRALSFASRTFGTDSDYYLRIEAANMTSAVGDAPLRLLHHLKAIKADIETGALVQVTRIVEADVFDDFLEQAEHLLTAGYRAPSAVILGCVLEDALRRVCHREGINLPDKPKLDAMNSELAKAGIYPNLFKRRSQRSLISGTMPRTGNGMSSHPEMSKRCFAM